MELTFGEQIKIILKRKNMTIRMLAELIEQQTGKPMSRQNLTQKLNRDNFQEQDMKEIAQALGCVVQISVIDPMEATVASLQSMMQPARPQVQEDTAVLPEISVVAAGSGRRTVQEDFVSTDKDDVDSDVLKEIEMALMESIQKEMNAPKEDAAQVNPRWQAKAQSQWRRQQELEEERQAEEWIYGPVDAGTEESAETEESAGTEKTEPEEEYDSLAWAHQKPAVWPRLIVPGENAFEKSEAYPAEAETETVSQDAEYKSDELPEIGAAYTYDEPEFVETEDDLDGLEFFELEELEGGDISGVSAPYTLKREQEEPLQEEKEYRTEPEEPGFGRMPDGPGGDISYVSAPYVIPREPEPEEPEPDAVWPGNADDYIELSLDEVPEQSLDDAAETVQEYGGQPEEPNMEEKMASWDAAVRRRLERPILMSSEERKARRAAKEAEEMTEREPEIKQNLPDINPLTGKEYETNTVKHHPTKPDMLLVYDQDEHRWIEQAERAFTNFQIRKRAMLGRDYEPPVYLD